MNTTSIRAALAGFVLVAVTGAVAACDPADNPGAPAASMTVTGRKNQTGGDITIKGTKFRPNAAFRAGYSGGPISGVEHGQTFYADAGGNLKIEDTVSCVPTAAHDDAFSTVVVTVSDQGLPDGQAASADQLTIGSISAVYWVCV
jgi:hypothetical protein